MPRYRVSKSFRVESGHMLSKHPEGCRHPHGHSRRIEIVVSSEKLDSNDMVVDFKAIKLAVRDFVEMYDHALCVNSKDPLLPALQKLHADGILIYDDHDPTTEVMAREVYEFTAGVLREGFKGKTSKGIEYRIRSGKVHLDRVRVTETDSSWAEYGD